MTTVGYVVGEVRTDEFTFVTNREIAPPRLEYIILPIQEPSRKIDVLAQVTSLSVSSRLLDTSLSYTEVESILNRLKSSPPIVVGTAKVLGYIDQDGEVRFPRHAATPGANVELAPDNLLREFSRRISPVALRSARSSTAPAFLCCSTQTACAATSPSSRDRRGQTYAVGVVLEKLLQLGGTVVVFDPNSDYVLMRRDEKHRATSFADRADVFRLPTTQAGRIPDEEIGGTKKFTMQFSKLEVDEICQMTGIAPSSTNIRKAIQTVWDKLQGRDYTPREFKLELESLAVAGDAAFGGMPRGPRAINPSIGNEQAFDRSFEDKVAEKANLESDWFDKMAPPASEPDPEPIASKPPSGKPPSFDAISGAGRALKYIERLEGVDIWGFKMSRCRIC
jgi:hypothetical protein